MNTLHTGKPRKYKGARGFESHSLRAGNPLKRRVLFCQVKGWVKVLPIVIRDLLINILFRICKQSKHQQLYDDKHGINAIST